MSIYKIFFFLLIVAIFPIDVKCINDIQLNMSFVILLEFQMLDQMRKSTFYFLSRSLWFGAPVRL